MDARLNDAAIHRTYSNSQRRAVLFNPLHFRLQATAPRFVVPTLVGGCDAEFGQGDLHNQRKTMVCGLDRLHALGSRLDTRSRTVALPLWLAGPDHTPVHRPAYEESAPARLGDHVGLVLEHGVVC